MDKFSLNRRMDYSYTRRLLWAMRGYQAQKVWRLLQESQWWAPERLAELRNQKLRRLVEHCYLQVPYYREVMQSLKLTPADFTSINDIQHLPILTKDLLRANQDRLLARNIPLSRSSVVQTGGTTGEPIRVRRRLSDSAWQGQCYARGLSWGGLAPQMKRIHLFGGSLGQKVKQGHLRRFWHRLTDVHTMLPAFELSSRNVHQYLDAIKRSDACHVISYASTIYLLAQLTEQAGREFRLKCVYPTAEMMPTQWRQKVASVFGCQVLCHYGCGEVNSLGFECGQGEGYHCCDEHAVLEIQAADGTTAFEGEGALLVSDLDNYAMPILRYANSDCAALSSQPCTCGRSGGRIVRLDGRVNDYLLSTSGERVSGAIAAHTFRQVQGVLFYQYVQSDPSRVTVRIVRGGGSFERTLEEGRIGRILRDHLGSDMDVVFEYPSDIQRTPAGKARFVINTCLRRPQSRTEAASADEVDCDTYGA